MATKNWSTALSGNFGTAADWTGGVAPTSIDDAVIDAIGKYTVTLTTNGTSVLSLSTIGTATFAISGANLVDTITNGTGSGVNAGIISVGDSDTLITGGNLKNTGTISLNASKAATKLEIADNVQINGGGHVTLSDNVLNSIVSNGTAKTLTNVNDVISGAGTIGDSTLTLVNNASGLINASGSKALTLNTGTNTIINSGTLEATGAGGLLILSNVNNAANGGPIGGLIEAVGSTAHVDLKSVTITGGTLATANGGKIDTVTGDFGTVLDGSTGVGGFLANTGTFVVTNNSAVTIEGSIGNGGTINLAATGAGPQTTELLINGTGAELGGGGSVVLSDNVTNVITGSAGTLINDNNTISGAGSIGAGNNNITFENDGIVNATGTKALTINTGTNQVINDGLIETTGTGGMVIGSAVDNTSGAIQAIGKGGLVIQNTITGGTVSALAANSHIDLGSGADLTGGSVQISVGAALNTTSTNTAIVDDTIDNGGTITVVDNSTLVLGADVNNTGTIAINGSTHPTNLFIDNNVSLAGGGKVTLTDNINNTIGTTGVAKTLTNVNDTITGAGTIGGNANLTLVNDGTINATGTKALTINTGTNAITNNGLLQSSGAGGLALQSALTNNGELLSSGATKLTLTGALTNDGTVLTSGTGGLMLEGAVTNTGLMDATGAGGLTILSTTVTNTGGTIAAAANNAHVDLQTATITDGTMTTTVGAKINSVANTVNTIDADAVNNAGSIVVADGSTLIIGTAINNLGTISLNGSAAATKLEIDGNNLILSGNGAVTLTDNANNTIVSDLGVARTLTNNGNTISGSGTIGDADLSVINNGIISSTGTKGLTLTGAGVTNNAGGIIKTTGTGGMTISTTVANSGVVSASGTGGLILSSTITGGTVSATVANSHIDLSNGILTGGTVTTVAGSKIDTVALKTGTISGTVINSGSIVVTDNSTLNLNGTINNFGSIAVNSSNDATILAITGATSLTSGGNVTLTDNAHNSLVTGGSGETLTNVNNTISGAGTIGDANFLTINNGGTINANGKVNGLVIDLGNNALTNTGVIEATGIGGQNLAGVGPDVLALDSAVTNNGIIETTGAGSIGMLISDVITNNGFVKLLGSGNHIDLVGGTITGGTTSTVAGSTINSVSGTNTIIGTVNNAGTIAIADHSTLNLEGVVTNSGTIAMNGATNTTTMEVSTELDLLGHGKVTLSNSVHNVIQSLGSGGTGTEHVTIAGADTPGDVVNLTFTNPGLSGNPVTVFYNVMSGNTATDIAAGLVTAISTNATLIADNIHATNVNGVITITEPNAVANATVVTDEVDGSLSATIGGTAQAGDKITLTFANPGIGTLPETVTYTTVGGDTLSTIAGHLATLINADGVLSAAGISADTPAGAVITINETGSIGSATTLSEQVGGSLQATVGGTITNGDTVSLTFDNAALAGTPVTITANVVGTDTTTSIAGKLTALINVNAALIAAGITAGSTNAIITISDSGVTLDQTTVSETDGNTETIGLSNTLTTTDTVGISNGGQMIGETVSLDNDGHLSGGGTSLNNLDNTISGAGTIGDLHMGINNAINGIINASQTTPLIIAAGVLDNSGLVETTGSGGMTIQSAVVVNDGNLLAAAGTLTVANTLTGDGLTTLSGSGGVDFGGDNTQQNVLFATVSNSKLEIDHSQTFSGAISGFNLGDSIDLTDISFAAGTTTAVYTPTSNAEGTLVITDTLTGDHATLDLLGTYVQGNFHISDDGSGGTLLTDPPATVQPAVQLPVAHLLTDPVTSGVTTPVGDGRGTALAGLGGSDPLNHGQDASILHGILNTGSGSGNNAANGGARSVLNAAASSTDDWQAHNQGVLANSSNNALDFNNHMTDNAVDPVNDHQFSHGDEHNIAKTTIAALPTHSADAIFH